MKKRLIKKTKSDDVLKFEVIFKEYYPRLIHFAIDYIFEYEAAREIVQDSMIKIWEKFQDLNFENNVSAYLYTLVKNSCINYLKHQTVQQKYSEYAHKHQTDNLLSLSALNNFSFNHIEYKQLLDAVEQAIDSLPELQIQENVTSELYTSWKDGKLMFKSESFKELALKMERWFDVEITILDEELKEKKFTGAFEKETIEQALKALSLSMPFKFNIEHNKISIFI